MNSSSDPGEPRAGTIAPANLTRRGVIGGASLLTLGTLAAAASPAPARTRILTRSSRDPAELLGRLAAAATTEMDALALPGLTIGVAGPDNLRATITLGYADLDRGLPLTSDHLFQIGSISKSIVSLCLFRLADQGRLDLDAKAASILPDIPWPDGDITIAMLLDHTSGLADIAPAFPRSPDGRLWTNYTPGTLFSYSNTGFGLLGLIVEKVCGRLYHEAAAELVLAPLGMSAARALIDARDRARYPMSYVPQAAGVWFPGDALTPGPWVDNELAGGSVAATPADMCAYIAYLAAVGRGRGAPLMSDTLAARYARPAVAAPQMGPKGQYAAGIAVIDLDGRSCLHHTGGMVTYSSAITVDPTAAGGVFVSTNMASGNYRPQRLSFYGCRLLRAFAEGSALPDFPPITTIPRPANAERFAGRFIAASGDAVTISASAKGMTIEADGKTARLMPGPGGFMTDHPRLRSRSIDFTGDESGDRFWSGGTLYGRGTAPTAPPVSRELAALAGRYVNGDPWWGAGFLIVVRGPQIVLDGVGTLVRAADGSWRVTGGVMPAERFWFEAVNDGRPQRLIFSGNDMRRYPDDSR